MPVAVSPPASAATSVAVREFVHHAVERERIPDQDIRRGRAQIIHRIDTAHGAADIDAVYVNGDVTTWPVVAEGHMRGDPGGEHTGRRVEAGQLAGTAAGADLHE